MEHEQTSPWRKVQAAGLSGMACLRSGAGALASALLMAWPGLTEVTVVKFRTNALLRLGEDLFPGQDRDVARVSWVPCVSAA